MATAVKVEQMNRTKLSTFRKPSVALVFAAKKRSQSRTTAIHYELCEPTENVTWPRISRLTATTITTSPIGTAAELVIGEQ
jgi:hypothetical protein